MAGRLRKLAQETDELTVLIYHSVVGDTLQYFVYPSSKVNRKGFQKLEPGMSLTTRSMKIAPLNIPPAPKKARGKEKFKPSKKAPRRNLGPWFGENATTIPHTGNTEQQQTSHLAYLKEMVDSIPSPSSHKETYPASSTKGTT